MSARADNNFLQSWEVFKTEKQNGRQIHYEMYYYSIYPEPLSSINRQYYQVFSVLALVFCWGGQYFVEAGGRGKNTATETK